MSSPIGLGLSADVGNARNPFYNPVMASSSLSKSSIIASPKSARSNASAKQVRILDPKARTSSSSGPGPPTTHGLSVSPKTTSTSLTGPIRNRNNPVEPGAPASIARCFQTTTIPGPGTVQQQVPIITSGLSSGRVTPSIPTGGLASQSTTPRSARIHGGSLIGIGQRSHNTSPIMAGQQPASMAIPSTATLRAASLDIPKLDFATTLKGPVFPATAPALNMWSSQEEESFLGRGGEEKVDATVLPGGTSAGDTSMLHVAGGSSPSARRSPIPMSRRSAANTSPMLTSRMTSPKAPAAVLGSSKATTNDKDPSIRTSNTFLDVSLSAIQHQQSGILQTRVANSSFNVLGSGSATSSARARTTGATFLQPTGGATLSAATSAATNTSSASTSAPFIATPYPLPPPSFDQIDPAHRTTEPPMVNRQANRLETELSRLQFDYRQNLRLLQTRDKELEHAMGEKQELRNKLAECEADLQQRDINYKTLERRFSDSKLHADETMRRGDAENKAAQESFRRERDALEKRMKESTMQAEERIQDFKKRLDEAEAKAVQRERQMGEDLHIVNEKLKAHKQKHATLLQEKEHELERQKSDAAEGIQKEQLRMEGRLQEVQLLLEKSEQRCRLETEQHRQTKERLSTLELRLKESEAESRCKMEALEATICEMKRAQDLERGQLELRVSELSDERASLEKSNKKMWEENVELQNKGEALRTSETALQKTVKALEERVSHITRESQRETRNKAKELEEALERISDERTKLEDQFRVAAQSEAKKWAADKDSAVRPLRNEVKLLSESVERLTKELREAVARAELSELNTSKAMVDFFHPPLTTLTFSICLVSFCSLLQLWYPWFVPSIEDHGYKGRANGSKMVLGGWMIQAHDSNKATQECQTLREQNASLKLRVWADDAAERMGSGGNGGKASRERAQDRGRDEAADGHADAGKAAEEELTTRETTDSRRYNELVRSAQKDFAFTKLESNYANKSKNHYHHHSGDGTTPRKRHDEHQVQESCIRSPDPMATRTMFVPSRDRFSASLRPPKPDPTAGLIRSRSRSADTTTGMHTMDALDRSEEDRLLQAHRSKMNDVRKLLDRSAAELRSTTGATAVSSTSCRDANYRTSREQDAHGYGDNFSASFSIPAAYPSAITGFRPSTRRPRPPYEPASSSSSRGHFQTRSSGSLLGQQGHVDYSPEKQKLEDEADPNTRDPEAVLSQLTEVLSRVTEQQEDLKKALVASRFSASRENKNDDQNYTSYGEDEDKHREVASYIQEQQEYEDEEEQQELQEVAMLEKRTQEQASDMMNLTALIEQDEAYIRSLSAERLSQSGANSTRNSRSVSPRTQLESVETGALGRILQLSKSAPTLAGGGSSGHPNRAAAVRIFTEDHDVRSRTTTRSRSTSPNMIPKLQPTGDEAFPDKVSVIRNSILHTEPSPYSALDNSSIAYFKSRSASSFVPPGGTGRASSVPPGRPSASSSRGKSYRGAPEQQEQPDAGSSSDNAFTILLKRSGVNTNTPVLSRNKYSTNGERRSRRTQRIKKLAEAQLASPQSPRNRVSDEASAHISIIPPLANSAKRPEPHLLRAAKLHDRVWDMDIPEDQVADLYYGRSTADRSASSSGLLERAATSRGGGTSRGGKKGKPEVDYRTNMRESSTSSASQHYSSKRTNSSNAFNPTIIAQPASVRRPPSGPRKTTGVPNSLYNTSLRKKGASMPKARIDTGLRSTGVGDSCRGAWVKSGSN
ncbi:unnamed protein product [Amoebophrya sp. A25]|nr:unnamed protein product [Amoebophrya sp. A25]|eukprot:GSA25T00017720001.1